jgi:NAD(P)-dependent dehydrogenase (short-subunit alcohol dehydrogenase family)
LPFHIFHTYARIILPAAQRKSPLEREEQEIIKSYLTPKKLRKKQKFSPAYVASKHASLTKNAALEYAGKKIRINAVEPGYIKTTLVMNTLDYPARGGYLAQ